MLLIFDIKSTSSKIINNTKFEKILHPSKLKSFINYSQKFKMKSANQSPVKIDSVFGRLVQKKCMFGF